ncbi:MAG: GIY-YIG nuclease family protein [Bosea sp. (in: a-proteobacteria)]
MTKGGYVYLMASRRYGTLYLGVTNDIVRRASEHLQSLIPGFSARYGVSRLVWFEHYDDILSAIACEKDMKKWRREWKTNLIEKDNPDWLDLFLELTVSAPALMGSGLRSAAPE